MTRLSLERQFAVWTLRFPDVARELGKRSIFLTFSAPIYKLKNAWMILGTTTQLFIHLGCVGPPLGLGQVTLQPVHVVEFHGCVIVLQHRGVLDAETAVVAP